MRELYDKIFKGSALTTTSESNTLWSDFGYLVYKQYLKKELDLERENSQLKQDLKFVGQFVPSKEKKVLSKRIKDQI